MFLNQLTAMEKEAFIHLGIHAVKANGIIDENEYAMLMEYCKEADIPCIIVDNVKPLEELIDIYRDSTDKNKKIVLMEILGLLHADGDYDQLEKTFAYHLAENIGLSKNIVDKQSVLVVKYLDFVKEMQKAIE